MAAAKYLVLVGVNYPGKGDEEHRAEPGDVVDDLPAKSLSWLLEQGVVTKDLKAELPAEEEE